MAKDLIVSGVLVNARRFEWQAKAAEGGRPARSGGSSMGIVVADPDEWGTAAEVAMVSCYAEKAALFHRLCDAGFGASVVLRCSVYAAGKYDERYQLVEVVSCEPYAAAAPADEPAAKSNGRQPAAV